MTDLLRASAYAAVVSIWLMAMGCAQDHPLHVSMFHDEHAHQPPVTTPSAMAVHAAETAEPSQLTRDHAALPVRIHDGTVLHLPLWIEDEHEHPDAGDSMELSGKDFLLLAYSPARFLVNLVIVPGRAFVNPPWEVTESDGRATTRYILAYHDPRPAGS